MTTTSLTSVADELRAHLDCGVLGPDDVAYDQARRVWNADIDRLPAAIVRCTSARDVSRTLTWCVAHDLPVTVRSGGHNLAGTSVADGAVLIDTALIDHVRIDTEARTVTVGAGCRWGDVDRPASELDIAVPAGVVSHTGVAGLTLGGGFGYLARQFGATVDWVQEIEVVVADGSVLRASSDEHADLFWALKGAGHNFGVATEFVFRYVDLPGLATVRQCLYGASDRKRLIERFAQWGPDAPANVGTYVRLLRAPEYWSQIPAAHRGEPILSVATVTYGDPADEPELTAGMFADVEPIWSSVRSIPHVTLQHATDDEFRYGVAHYWKHLFLKELTPEAIDTVIEQADAYPGRALNSSAFIAHQLMCPFEMIAGSRTPRDGSNDSTAGVGSLYSANIGADWEYPGEKAPLVAWAKAFDEAMRPYQGGTYVNFASEGGDDAAARAVYGTKYDRLVQVKQRYDAANVFARGLVDLTRHEEA
ncbi:FAD-binding oxidoreductase [Luteimicrobium xylanilyticum]|uniref:(R)-6-hydroxynicotine oxidase n=1 Tax=Luteimicrobium xylanilyticum TaxID=1133546 RepID=A0A5P9Q8H5_9MICO|nr:FAD-binding oxidoreductase [Luteimicrobium xylanilyticum]QFU96715.1 (R)-6-hydroxynicotine oxidase [Luteimicrobium xylanilyticum]